MGMIEGSLLSQTNLRGQGVFPPEGLAGNLPDTVVKPTGAGAVSLEFGTTTSQVDTIVCQDRAIAAGTSATYDLYTGTDLKNIHGETAAFRVIRFVGVFIVDGGDTSGVEVGDASSDEWVGFFGAEGDTVKIFPSGAPFQVGSPAGAAVGSGTKNFKIANLGAEEVTVRIWIGGSIQVAGGLMGILGLTYP